MRHIKLRDSRMIVLRPMTESFIIPGGDGRCPANCDMMIGGSMVPTDAYRDLTVKMIRRYGTTAILAMDQDLVAGFVSFFPSWCPRYDLCNDEQIKEGLDHIDEIEDPPRHFDLALHVNCLIIKERYRGNYLSVHLLEYLKDWARARGWRKIVAFGCIFSGKAQYQWLISPKPPKPIWEKAGFFPGEDFRITRAGSTYELAEKNREWYRTFQFPDYVPRDVDPDDPDWYRIFRDYTMICPL